MCQLSRWLSRILGMQAVVGAGIPVEAQAVEGLIEKLMAALQPSLTSQGQR